MLGEHIAKEVTLLHRAVGNAVLSGTRPIAERVVEWDYARRVARKVLDQIAEVQRQVTEALVEHEEQLNRDAIEDEMRDREAAKADAIYDEMREPKRRQVT